MSIEITMINKLIPITQFNKGQASRIFERLSKEKELIVLKNNKPSAILLSPEEYKRLTEIEENYRLMVEANTRLNKPNAKIVSYEDAIAELGIEKSDLKVAEDVLI